jgi:biotin carboxylase
MKPARVLVLEAAGPEAAAITATAVRAGYQVHAVTQRPPHPAYSQALKPILTDCFLTDFTDPHQALDNVTGYARRIGADAIVTTNEYLTPLLAQVCAALDLPGNDPALAAAGRNKITMNEAFIRAGVSTPRTRAVVGTEDLHRLTITGQVRFPCVLKPAEGAGSAGVSVVHDVADLTAAWRAAQAPQGMYGLRLDRRVLAQDYIDGSEYSVESFTQNGETTHVCVPPSPSPPAPTGPKSVTASRQTCPPPCDRPSTNK